MPSRLHSRVAAALCVVVFLEASLQMIGLGPFDYPLNNLKYWGATSFRILLDFQIGMLLAVLPSAISALLGIGLFLYVAAAVVLYLESSFFLSPSLLRSNFAEGVAAAGAAGQLGGTSVAYLLVAALGLAVFLKFNQSARVPVGARRLVTILVAVVLLDLFYATAVDRARRIMTFASPKRLMLSYGIVGYQVIDARYLAFSDMQAIYAQQLAAFSPLQSPPPEPLPVKPASLYMIQWESLDRSAWAMIDADNPLKPLWNPDTGQTLRPEHINGSADTDYSVLTALPTARGINPYRLAATGQERFLAKELASQFESSAFIHCNIATFFSRHRRIDDFGFDRVYWAEDFSQASRNSIFFGQDDPQCVKAISEQIGFRPSQFLYFVTLSSHFPYAEDPSGKESMFDIPARYRRSITESAKAVGDLVNAVPDRSLIVIFGDHPAIGLPGYVPDDPVPLICAMKIEGVLKPCRFPLAQTPVWALGDGVLGLILGSP